VVRNRGRVTRFVVMAMLQAARARSLGLPKDSAYSWGLNRAIFYAAAKAGFRGGQGSGEESTEKPTPPPSRETYRLGDDEAFRDPRVEPLTFVIGDEAQTAAAFDREVVARFGTKENFGRAWDEATRIMEGFDRATLESRRRFYEEVYKPRRDELSDSWTRDYSPPAKGRG
jgi:hypothetical protein